MDDYIQTEREGQYVAIAAALAERFAERAPLHDRDGSFPQENVADLRAACYHTLTIPEEYGGLGATISEMVLCQERLARGDASTALGIGQHLTFVSGIIHNQTWPAERCVWLCREVVEQGALFNSAASEPEMGSPSRGGKPTTTARRTDHGWLINGRKNFTTYSYALAYFVTSATVINEDKTANFLVPQDTPGAHIEPTWDTMGMRATASHDLVLVDALVPLEARIEVQKTPEGIRPRQSGSLHFAATYLGVAGAARDWIVNYMTEYGLANDPLLKLRLGRLELDLMTARTMIMDAARRCDSMWPDAALGVRLSAMKVQVTNAAVGVVDQAMRIARDAGLDRRYPLERFYRDVRGGLHNPPMDDAALNALASAALTQT